MRRDWTRTCSFVVLSIAPVCALAQSRPQPNAVTAQQPLNSPDEGLHPAPIQCRALVGDISWDSAATSRLRAIMRDSNPASDRAAALAVTLPDLRTFEELETRACTLVGHGAPSMTYSSFIDSVVPLVLAANGTVTRASEAPRPVGPRDGIRYDIYPRRTTVTWSSVAGAEHYLLEVQELTRVELRKQSGEVVDMGPHWLPHNGGLHSAVVRDTTASFYFIGAQPGRWRVRAIRADGRSTAPSGWRTFAYEK